jgi:hypothetical protein
MLNYQLMWRLIRLRQHALFLPPLKTRTRKSYACSVNMTWKACMPCEQWRILGGPTVHFFIKLYFFYL